MQKFLEWLDQTAEIETEKSFPKWLERIAFFFLILMVLSAPHSIAATQTAWLTGMFVWTIRLFVKPRLRLVRTPLDIALWAFFGWSLISSVFSYDAATSFDRLRNVLLFLIFYFVINVARNSRAVKFLAVALIFSCMANVLWTPVERIFGRGVEVSGVKAESPLLKGTVKTGLPITEGDTIIEVNKKKIRSPEKLLAEIERNDVSQVVYYRPDFNSVVEVKRADLLSGENAVQRLGIIDWKHSRVWRSAGFYGHYTTYAEVLQLITSLAFGLFIASLGRKREEKTARKGMEETKSSDRNLANKFLRLFFSPPLLLLFCLAGMALALLLTATRASQLGFLVSAVAVVLANGNRKMLLTLAAVILPLAFLGLIFLQQSRGVGFFDTKDDSTKWRQTVYREGFDLWTKNSRHFFLGVGMDSIKKYAKDWHLFDDGRLPTGHFHSTPLQLLVERGLPALLLWLLILWIYMRTLIKAQTSRFKVQSSENEDSEVTDWKTNGILLGCFGGAVGFFTSGLVHFNLGDAEVAMVFFLLMGLSVSLAIKNAKRLIIKFNLKSNVLFNFAFLI